MRFVAIPILASFAYGVVPEIHSAGCRAVLTHLESGLKEVVYSAGSWATRGTVAFEEGIRAELEGKATRLITKASADLERECADQMEEAFAASEAIRESAWSELISILHRRMEHAVSNELVGKIHRIEFQVTNLEESQDLLNQFPRLMPEVAQALECRKQELERRAGIRDPQVPPMERLRTTIENVLEARRMMFLRELAAAGRDGGIEGLEAAEAALRVRIASSEFCGNHPDGADIAEKYMTLSIDPSYRFILSYLSKGSS